MSLFPEKKEVIEVGWWEKNAVNIAAFVFNLFVVVGEWRVYDFVRRATASIALSVLAVLTVGLPFLLYELLWKQRMANKKQRKLSFSMALGSLCVTAIVGALDYIFVSVDVSPAAESIALGAIALMLTAHTFALLYYVYNDDTIRAMWNAAKEEAETKKELADLERVDNLLKKRQEIADKRKAVDKKYEPANVDKQLAALHGETVNTENKDEQEGNFTNRQQS